MLFRGSYADDWVVVSRNLPPSNGQQEDDYPFAYDKLYITYQVAPSMCAATFNDELCLDELEWQCENGENILIECQDPSDVYVIPGTATSAPTTTSTTITTTSTTTSTAAPISCCDVMQIKYDSVEIELQAIERLTWIQDPSAYYSMQIVYSSYLAIYAGDDIQCYIGPNFDTNICPVDISGPWRCKIDGIYTNTDVQIDCMTDSNTDDIVETTVVTTTTSATTTTTTTTTSVDQSCCQSVDVVLDGVLMEMIASEDQFVSDSHHLVSLNVYGKDYWVLMRNWHPVFSPSGITVDCFATTEANCPSDAEWHCNSASFSTIDVNCSL